MSIELVSVLSAVLAAAIGWALVRGRFARPEVWAAASVAIHLIVANVLNRGLFLDRMSISTATMLAMASGLLAVVAASLVLRVRRRP